MQLCLKQTQRQNRVQTQCHGIKSRVSAGTAFLPHSGRESQPIHLLVVVFHTWLLLTSLQSLHERSWSLQILSWIMCTLRKYIRIFLHWIKATYLLSWRPGLILVGLCVTEDYLLPVILEINKRSWTSTALLINIISAQWADVTVINRRMWWLISAPLDKI